MPGRLLQHILDPGRVESYRPRPTSSRLIIRRAQCWYGLDRPAQYPCPAWSGAKAAKIRRPQTSGDHRRGHDVQNGYIKRKKAGHKRPAKFGEERKSREGSKPPLTA